MSSIKKKQVKVIHLDKSIDSDSEYETESETEYEKPKQTKPKNEIIEIEEVRKIEGKPEAPKKKKRVMTEEHKAHLAKARIKAREVLKAKSEVRNRRKEMRSEHMLLKKLELERDLQKHEDYKKKLIMEGGFKKPAEGELQQPVKKERKKRITSEQVDEGLNETHASEIEALEEKIRVLKETTHARGYGKKKQPEPEPVSESESEPEPEPEPVKIRKKKVREVRDTSERDADEEGRNKPPVMPLKKYDTVIKKEDRPIVNRQNKTTNDQEIQRQINLLFPKF